MHRTQILLEDDQYERLKTESARTGKSIGELIRAAVTDKYGELSDEDYRQRLRKALRESAGSADPGDFDGLSGEEYVARVRRQWTERVDRLWTERSGEQ
ncbi:MAG TPA: ribbon-helix-helix protein, CopG family [Mycobacteriales bacterium]